MLYLRFCVYCRYVTMFWAALPVTDGTAEGLHDLIERHFEAMNVPIDKLYSFASDGASVVSSETGFSRCLSSPLTLCMRVRVPVVDVHMRQDGPHHAEAAEQPVDDHA